MLQQRLDYLVAKKLGVSRSAAESIIAKGLVSVDGSIIIKSGKKIRNTSAIEINEESADVLPEIDFDIVYEDEDCVVIDKPAGVLVHSKGGFSPENTVASWLLPKTRGFEENNNRAGIVHRLDRGTSGVMICAKSPEALAFFQKQFSARKTKKRYHALISGLLQPPEAIIDIPIERNPKDPKKFRTGSNGKPAETSYSTAKVFKHEGTDYSLLELTPKTGRTHQLRVHLAYMKHPIVGDDFYGGMKADRLYLHASSLEITLPKAGRKVFSVDLPNSFYRPKIIR